MRKKIKRDALTVLGGIQKLFRVTPGIDQMYREIQMMKFKIRPIQGNVMAFNLNNARFIETLWRLGKLEEFFQKEYDKLSTKEQRIFVKVFDEIYKKQQDDLNHVDLKQTKPSDKQGNFLEIEIFKEKILKKKPN